MRIINITKQSGELNVIKNLYHRAFPQNERLPFWFLLWRTRQNDVDFLALYDIEDFVGFTYIIYHDDITFVFYFAICESFRSKGYGSKILELIKCKAPYNRIILSIEAPYVNSENQQQREKRKAFYVRNGFSQATWNLQYGSEIYEVLTSNGEIEMKEYLDLVKCFAGSFLYIFFKPKLVLR